jgi:ABC-type sugar transport system substrate-binding protein
LDAWKRSGTKLEAAIGSGFRQDCRKRERIAAETKDQAEKFIFETKRSGSVELAELAVEEKHILGNWLTAHPGQVNGIIGENDEMALGAIQALKSAKPRLKILPSVELTEWPML